MAQINFMSYDKEDTRLLTVLDPCVGTGSMLLPASNYSLRLFGQDIVRDLCLCSELNGWLWMPWLVYMPEHTRAMLEAAAEGQNPVPVGVALSESAQKATLAEERRASAEAFYAAARNGELQQERMF